MIWTDDRLYAAIRASRGAQNGKEAARRVSLTLGFPVSSASLQKAIYRARSAGKTTETLKDLLSTPSVYSPPAEWTVYALWSDLHIGSDDCNEQAIVNFQEWALDMGARHFLCAGDWCDGTYTKRGGQHEQNYIGLDEQIDETLRLLNPRGAHYIIDGNHEHTFYIAGGSRPGEHLENAARRAGRLNIQFLGYPGGRVELDGIRFELRHYKRGGGRGAAMAYLKNKMDYDIPDVLVGGHYHIEEKRTIRGCVCIQPGAMQNETDFMSATDWHPTGGGLLFVQHTEPKRYLWEFRDYTPGLVHNPLARQADSA